LQNSNQSRGRVLAVHIKKRDIAVYLAECFVSKDRPQKHDKHGSRSNDTDSLEA